jgi:hypothetical protein
MGSNVAPISSKNRVSRKFDALLHPHSALGHHRLPLADIVVSDAIGAGADRIADASFGQTPGAWLIAGCGTTSERQPSRPPVRHRW